MNKQEIKNITSIVIQAMQGYSLLEEKCENIKKAITKENFEKVFWQRKCKFYAPNKMEDHYNELDEELKKTGLFIDKTT